jgi:hypothetical protein
MNEFFLKNITVIKQAIKQNKLVVFVGAGISIDSGVPSWADLIHEFRKEIEIPASETDYLRIAQMYYNERGPKELTDKVRDALKYKKLHYNLLHESIFQLNPEHIITTNFDDLLEQVIKAKAHPFSVIKKDEQFPYAQNTRLLVKIHGDLEEGNVVIKEEDYLEYPKNHPLFESFIKGVFANKVVLFIGYSFSDINLKIILSTVRNILGKDFQNAYMLSVENAHHSKREYLKEKGIILINYSDAELFIEQYLFVGRNALNASLYKKIEILSDEGRKLLYLINFIHKYLSFEESIKNDDPLLQMRKSLLRFDEVNVLPPAFLGNLYPFNNRKAYIFNYNYNYLGSPNKSINEFFFDDFVPGLNTLHKGYLLKYAISEDRRQEYEESLLRVLKQLNFSGIHFFGRNNAKLQLFDTPKEFTEKVNISIDNIACTCLLCAYDRLDIKQFLRKLAGSSITETSAIKDDLLIAYCNYKVGSFQVSYSQFEEIANKSWQLGKYLSYYIAKQNIKYLRNLINWDGDETENELRKEIVQKIDDLDLEKLLSLVPNLDGDQYTLLKKIKENEYLHRASRKINEYYDKLVDLKDLYQGGGHSEFGPYYPGFISYELEKLFSFYAFNYLIQDEFDVFKKVFNKGLKGIFLSASIHDTYPEKLKEIDFWMLRFTVEYVSETDLRKSLDMLGSSKLAIYKSDEAKVIQLLFNLLRSIYTESNVLGRTITLDSNLSTHNQRYFFKRKLTNITHNVLLMFSYVEIPLEYKANLKQIVFDFLKAENFLFWQSENFLVSFLHNIIEGFGFDDLTNLLKIAVEKRAKYANEGFFDLVAYGFKNNCPGAMITDQELIKSIVEFSYDKKNRDRQKGYKYLWLVCSPENKTFIENSLREDLNTTFDATGFLNLCYLQIFSVADYLPEMIQRLEKDIPQELQWKNGRIYQPNLLFLNLVQSLYYKGVDFTNPPVQPKDFYPAFWNFYFSPQTFDYSLFDVKWLLMTKYEPVHKKLATIPRIGREIKDFLLEEYNEELGSLFSRYYLDTSETFKT